MKCDFIDNSDKLQIYHAKSHHNVYFVLCHSTQYLSNALISQSHTNLIWLTDAFFDHPPPH